MLRRFTILTALACSLALLSFACLARAQDASSAAPPQARFTCAEGRNGPEILDRVEGCFEVAPLAGRIDGGIDPGPVAQRPVAAPGRPGRSIGDSCRTRLAGVRARQGADHGCTRRAPAQ